MRGGGWPVPLLPGFPPHHPLDIVFTTRRAFLATLRGDECSSRGSRLNIAPVNCDVIQRSGCSPRNAVSFTCSAGGAQVASSDVLFGPFALIEKLHVARRITHAMDDTG